MKARSLRSHMMSLYVLLALISGLAVPALSLWLTIMSLRQYQAQGRSSMLESLTASIEASYSESEGWDRHRLRDMLRPMPHLGVSSITVWDANGGRLAFAGPRQRNQDKGPQSKKPVAERRVAGVRFNAKPFGPPDENTPLNTAERMLIPLFFGDRRTGTLDADLRMPADPFGQMFMRSMSGYTAVGTLMMMAAACALGYIVSGRLSRPVVQALARTKGISRGEYAPERVEPSGIRETDALSRGVEELARSLAGQEKLRRRLMSDVAHELRTPLTVVRSQIEAFADGIWEPTQERLDICAAEISRLSGLIDDVQSLSTLEADATALRLQDTDMNEFLNGVADAFHPLFEEKGLTLKRSFESHPAAAIDRERFRHVIDNLLSNALRYTPSPSEDPSAPGLVELRLRSDGEDAIIEVEDSGIGISEEDLPHIFDRFYRSDESRARVSGGRGIGLSIAKASIEAHGGTIEADSTQGSGSVFTIRLPRL